MNDIDKNKMLQLIERLELLFKEELEIESNNKRMNKVISDWYTDNNCKEDDNSYCDDDDDKDSDKWYSNDEIDYSGNIWFSKDE